MIVVYLDVRLSIISKELNKKTLLKFTYFYLSRYFWYISEYTKIVTIFLLYDWQIYFLYKFIILNIHKKERNKIEVKRMSLDMYIVGINYNFSCYF